MPAPSDGKCPYCGGDLETGTIGAEMFLGGPKWHQSRSLLATGGEKIGQVRWDGMAWLDGVRCAHCRVIFLKY